MMSTSGTAKLGWINTNQYYPRIHQFFCFPKVPTFWILAPSLRIGVCCHTWATAQLLSTVSSFHQTPVPCRVRQVVASTSHMSTGRSNHMDPYGSFHKWGYTQNRWFIMENLFKMDDLRLQQFSRNQGVWIAELVLGVCSNAQKSDALWLKINQL